MSIKNRLKRAELAAPSRRQGPLVCARYDDDPECGSMAKCEYCGAVTGGRGPVIIQRAGKRKGKNALSWTRLSCTRFTSNQVRLGLFVLAYNLGNFMRRFALPSKVSHWSLRSIQLKLIKIGAKVISHARRTIFQMAEVAVPEALFAELLERIRYLAAAPT